MNLHNITHYMTSINSDNWVMVSAISTTVLAIVAIYSIFFNIKLWRSQDKPWLNFRLKHEIPVMNPNVKPENVSYFSLIVENVGKGAALDIKFEIDKLDKNIEIDSLPPKFERFVYKIPESFIDNELRIHKIVYKDINKLKGRQKPQIISF